MKMSHGRCLWFGNIVVMKESKSGHIKSLSVRDRSLAERLVLAYVPFLLIQESSKLMLGDSVTYGNILTRYIKDLET
jgi:hypothetical protein